MPMFAERCCFSTTIFDLDYQLAAAKDFGGKRDVLTKFERELKPDSDGASRTGFASAVGGALEAGKAFLQGKDVAAALRFGAEGGEVTQRRTRYIQDFGVHLQLPQDVIQAKLAGTKLPAVAAWLGGMLG